MKTNAYRTIGLDQGFTIRSNPNSKINSRSIDILAQASHDTEQSQPRLSHQSHLEMAKRAVGPSTGILSTANANTFVALRIAIRELVPSAFRLDVASTMLC